MDIRTPAPPRRRVRFVLVLAVAIALESVGIWSLHYTVGVPAQVMAAFLLSAGSAVLGAILGLAGRMKAGYRTVGAGALIVLAAAFWFGHLWIRLHLEAQRAVIYAYEQKVEGGQFPEDLRGYQSRDPLWKHHFQGFLRRGDTFRLAFYVGDPSVSYWYDSKTGWGYYPD